jgi:hypothetical protein
MSVVRVAPERLAGWVERFAASHGEVSRSVALASDGGTSPSSWVLTAADGSWARLTSWTDAVADDAAGEDGSLGEWALPPPLLVVLVRRGGYAVAVASQAGDLVAHKVGTRHVQSRTAAGGWSQQRYARRRGNQADALVQAVVEAAAARFGALVVDLRDFGGREHVRPDHIHPTAFGQIEIAERALDELGATLDDVVRTRIYITDVEDWHEVARAHGEVFGEIRPASAMLVITGTLNPAWKVEIEADALLPE